MQSKYIARCDRKRSDLVLLWGQDSVATMPVIGAGVHHTTIEALW